MNQLAALRLPGVSARRLIGFGALAIFVWLIRDHLLDSLLFAARHLLLISPLVLLAMVVTAWLMASGAVAKLSGLFAGHQGRMIVLVSLVGAMTPVCGVTVLPLVAGLLIGGVPIAPIMAFLLSSPITSPEMLAITAD